jgi:hypothetical protein
MEKAFLSVVSDYKINALTNSSSVDDLIVSLENWEKHLRKCSPYVISSFKNLHYEQLTKLVFFMRTNPKLRKHHDVIFTNILDFKKQVPKNVTKIFHEFIKGITYLNDQSQPLSEPVYHRLDACGSGTDSFRKEYNQCTNDMTRKNRNNVKKRIETCYMERLIYDALYKEFSMDDEQNDGHLYRLKLTKEDFTSCFPVTSLNVQVEFDQHLPIRLIITRSQYDKVYSVETYTRTIIYDSVMQAKVYDDIVEAIKKTGNGEYFKVQTFTTHGPWRKIQ